MGTRVAARQMLGSSRSDASPPSGVWLPALVACVYVWVTVVAWSPHEDAAMLFSYSENLANGYGVVFNPAESPVDGASDLMFMVLIGGLVRLGTPLVLGAAIVNAFGAALVFSSVRWAWAYLARVPSAWAALAAVTVCFGPLLAITVAGFGLAFFCGITSVMTALAIVYVRNPSTKRGVILGLFIGAAGIDRIEGFLLGALVIVGLCVAYGCLARALVPGLVAVGIAAVFMAARWAYFGYPLPNAYYKKGGGALYLDSIPPSIINLVLAAAPWIVLLCVAAMTNRRRAALSYLLLVGGGWASVWMLLSNEMNFLGRFQFPVVPSLAMLSASLFPAVAVLLRRVSGVLRWGLSVVVVGLSLASLVIPNMLIAQDKVADDSLHASLASALQPFAGSPPRTMAVTEAGFAAWKSDWKVVDLWGLNDQKIAHSGYLTESELADLNPEMIFAHVPAGPGSRNAHAGERGFLVGWTTMTDPVMCFAQQSNYQLVGAWERSDDDWFLIMARRDLPDLPLMIRAVQGLSSAPSPNWASRGWPPLPTKCDP